jgi:ParB-like chromosome segregation protein Spo0J
MQIYDKRLDEIKPYENNPRHNDNAVDAVANSIREFGFKVPIVVDSEGVIVAGHTRYKAAQKLGLQTVPCLVADDLNEEQINAFRLADNKVSELATWDEDLLNIELDNITDIDMGDFGFDLGIDEPDEPAAPSEPDFNYKEQYAVVVTCKNEQEQEQTYNKLTEMGYECKVVAV